eukprot:scaffold1.g5596.t1
MDVTLEDQQQINTFSKLNTRMHELQAKIAAKKSDAEDFEEAGNEVMLLDEERVPYVVGECFVHLPREEVEEKLQQSLDETQEQIRQLEGELAGVRTEMAALKTVLYGKFGSSIQLEDD